MGAEIRFEVEITAVDFSGDAPKVTSRAADGSDEQHRAAFRARCLGLRPHAAQTTRPASPFVVSAARGDLHARTRSHRRRAPSTGRRSASASIPTNHEIWSWLIPFSNGTASVGIVSSVEHHQARTGSLEEQFWQALRAEPRLHELLANARDRAAGRRTGRLRGHGDAAARPAFRVARQCGGVPRSGVLLGRDDRDEVREPRGGGARPAAQGRERRLGARVRRAAQLRRRDVPQFRRRLVRRQPAGRHLLPAPAGEHPPHDLLGARGLRLGQATTRTPGRSPAAACARWRRSAGRDKAR